MSDPDLKRITKTVEAAGSRDARKFLKATRVFFKHAGYGRGADLLVYLLQLATWQRFRHEPNAEEIQDLACELYPAWTEFMVSPRVYIEDAMRYCWGQPQRHMTPRSGLFEGSTMAILGLLWDDPRTQIAHAESAALDWLERQEAADRASTRPDS